jgi:hypothetical protein
VESLKIKTITFSPQLFKGEMKNPSPALPLKRGGEMQVTR